MVSIKGGVVCLPEFSGTDLEVMDVGHPFASEVK